MAPAKRLTLLQRLPNLPQYHLRLLNHPQLVIHLRLDQLLLNGVDHLPAALVFGLDVCDAIGPFVARGHFLPGAGELPAGEVPDGEGLVFDEEGVELREGLSEVVMFGVLGGRS